MRGHTIKRALFRRAGRDDRAARAAFENGFFGAQIEPSSLNLGAVTACAIGRENRRDLLLKITIRLRLRDGRLRLRDGLIEPCRVL